MIYPGHITTVTKLYQQFDGKSAASLFLKNYFRQHRSHGSRDRRIITEGFFSLLRIGNAFAKRDFLFRHMAASALTVNEQWQTYWKQHHHEAFAAVESELVYFDAERIFPCAEHISSTVDKVAFIKSHLHENDIFLRVNNSYQKKVQQYLTQQQIPYEVIPKSNSIRIQRHADLMSSRCYQAGAFEVQDLMSQACMEQIEVLDNETWLDACAGSGGKTLALMDRVVHLGLKNVTITVNDVRPAIIKSAQSRLAKYNFTNIHFSVADACLKMNDKMYDKIIIDAPCSGSGTWARSPEALSIFSHAQLEEFVVLQKLILANVLQVLRKGGYAYYITCSVYQNENEDVLAILPTDEYTILSSEYYKGYDTRADTMFMATIYKHK
ncbi:MAG: methyltransferase domain-containing protein [Bacteroidetes bacterium]|nr:methyltransferase domain-containing protein [Bacteroidota bacterium]